jgi:hypothetical protein
LPKEKILAISIVTPTNDSIGRPNSKNCTILIDTRQLEEAFKQILTQEIPQSPPRELPEITLTLEVT